QEQECPSNADEHRQRESEVVPKENPTRKKKADRDQRSFHSEMKKGKRVRCQVSSVRNGVMETRSGWNNGMLEWWDYTKGKAAEDCRTPRRFVKICESGTAARLECGQSSTAFAPVWQRVRIQRPFRGPK